MANAGTTNNRNSLSPSHPFSPSRITILIADDHPIFRQGLKDLIEQEPGFQVVAEAGDGEAALELITTEAPAVAVLDLDMPGLDGFAVAQRARLSNLPVRIIVLTMHKDSLHFNQALDVGVSGYVVKESAATEIIDCIKTVIKGREYFSPALSSFLLARSRRATSQPEQTQLSELTPTERRILLLLSDLKTTKEIAAELGVSPRTIDNHRAHICGKLGLQGSHALTKFALQHKNEL
jgi:DNA-binding NarL/FixJ family response regulator